MFEDVVGFEALADFYKMSCRGRSLPRSGHSGFRIADDGLTVGDQAGPEQRGHWREYRGRIAAGICDQLRAAQFLARKFGQPVDGFLQKVRASVLEAVKFRVTRRVAQSERSANVNNGGARIKQRGRDFM